MRGLFPRHALLGSFLAAALTGCGNSGDSAATFTAKNAYSERELAANPVISLKPGQTAAMFMEPRNAVDTGQADTGPLGSDVIPITIDRDGQYTYSLDGISITDTVARAEMLKLPGMEKLFELNAANPSVTMTLAAGSYLMKLYSNYTVADSGGADHRMVFLRPEAGKSALKMAAEVGNGNAKQLLSGSCSGCDLERVDLSKANLREVDLSGASIAGANLTQADITGTNLVGADLTGTIWTTGTTGRAITIVNDCSTEIWAAAAGNDAPKTCQSSSDCGGGECDATTHLCKQVYCGTNADCPNNSYCGGVPSFEKKTCTTSADCGQNRFCGANHLCGWNTCKFVPLPVNDVIRPAKTCTSNGDCCTGDKACKSPFCFTTVSHSGQCANVPADNEGNSWDMTTGYTQTIPVPSPWGGRFWARTGCTTTYSPCGTPPCQKNSDCTNGGTCNTTADPAKSANYCRSDEDCSAAPHQKCDRDGTPGFISDKYTCQQDSDCDKYAPDMVCIAYPEKTSPKRCGFHQCYWYMCTDPGNCNPQFSCDTGKCLGADGKTFSRNCRASGEGSPTLAELYMPLYFKYDSKGNKTTDHDKDFYDISLVDGANVPVQISPDVKSYALDPAGKSCATNKDCWDVANRGGHELACLQGKCVDKYGCGSPGCTSAAECDKYGQGNGLVKPSAWGGRNLAILEADCRDELKLKNKSGTYVGCLSPKDACGASNPDPILQCGAAISGQGTYLQLYECDGAISGVSCYSDGARKSTTCCGCPSWSVDPLFCAGTNQQWLAVSDLYYQIFHDASPTSYSFPFDDFNSTFTCAGKKEDVLVNYTVTFCPK